MAITVEGFRERFPEFDEPVVTDAQVESAISTAYCMFDETKCGSCGDEIAYNLIAHLLFIRYVDKGTGTIKGVASESLGEASHSFSESKSAIPQDAFYATRYGQMYQQLVNTNCPKIGLILSVV